MEDVDIFRVRGKAYCRVHGVEFLYADDGSMSCPWCNACVKVQPGEAFFVLPKKERNVMEFTKGPWNYHAHPETIISGDGVTVVYELNTNEADGRLIAASPDLYEALKDAIDLIESYKTARHSRVLIDAKAAIKKAEGK